MRIDSGLSNHFYQGRVQTLEGNGEDGANETATPTRPRVATNPSVSSTLLSPSLASALWSMEGQRRGASIPTAEEVRAATKVERVEASYLEHALGEDGLN